MKFKHSIQKRVFAIFGGFTLVVALGYSLASIIVAYIIEDEVLNRLVALEETRIQSAYKQTGQLPHTSAAYFTVYKQIQMAPSDIAAAASNNTVGEVFSASGRHYHIRKLHLSSNSKNTYNAILVADVTELLAVRNLPLNVIVFLALLIVLAIAIALLAALIITRRTTKPIVALANRVGGLEVNNQLAWQKNAAQKTQAEDEVDYLSQTIQNALQQLREAIERESQFNRDVSHELRTPLTEILNTLALAQQQSLSANSVQQITRAANNIKHIVTALLALARAETTQQEVFALQPLIEECVVGLYTKIEATNFTVECNLTDLAVMGNRQLVSLVINNLIENAINHASKPALAITVSNGEIHFDNTFSTPLPTDVTLPNSRQPQSQGIGQGLYLIERILDMLGWQYRIFVQNNTYRLTVIPLTAKAA